MLINFIFVVGNIRSSTNPNRRYFNFSFLKNLAYFFLKLVSKHIANIMMFTDDIYVELKQIKAVYRSRSRTKRRGIYCIMKIKAN